MISIRIRYGLIPTDTRIGRRYVYQSVSDRIEITDTADTVSARIGFVLKKTHPSDTGGLHFLRCVFFSTNPIRADTVSARISDSDTGSIQADTG